ncbi:HTH-type transcriptional activator Btr [Vibrio quintilis]|uniref:HTH-type transcriptional activator Btr n=2 Tax=Vibrio quintilis TaxID=1117707 RepID=A0A1M7YYD7_9VIBR|nr:HTH-type transcriptional activator Btr [Vibrio quintilis]
MEVFPCSLFLIPPNVSHDLKGLDVNSKDIVNSKDMMPERYSLWIEKEWMSNMLIHCREMRKLSNIFGHDIGIFFSQHTASEVKNVIRQIDYKTSSLEQLSVLLRVFSLMIQDKAQVILSSPERVHFESEKDRVEALSLYLDRNYSKDISLTDLAKHIYCSERTVNRIFKKHFGETFSQRLKKIRLSHAAGMLETSGLKVSYICQMTGYKNLSNFNRQFRAYKGLTPIEYRAKFSG